MKTAKLKIKKLTDRVNGYGMPIVEVTSNTDIKIKNRGYNEFEPMQEIDETDLARLHNYFHSFSTGTLMLEIQCPKSVVNCWYKLDGVYLGGLKHSCIIW
jgi:hypothetical protein